MLPYSGGRNVDVFDKLYSQLPMSSFKQPRQTFYAHIQRKGADLTHFGYFLFVKT